MIGLLKKALRYFLGKVNKEIIPANSFGRNPLLDVLSILKIGNESFRVFDVGANIGVFTSEVTKLIPAAQVSAFEPFPDAFLKLSQISEMSFGRVKAYGVALSDKCGEISLYLNKQSVTNSLLPNDAQSDKYQPSNYAVPIGTMNVKVDTLDSFCFDNDIPKIHLLKIDTQGADINVLKGGERLIDTQKICAILVEVLFVPMYKGQGWFEDIYGWLISKGFQLVGLYDVAHAEGTHEAKWADALFINRMAIQSDDKI